MMFPRIITNTNAAYQKVFDDACQTGDTNQLAQLIADGKFQVDVTLCSYIDRPPLLDAIAARSFPVAELLLENGADLNGGGEGQPIHQATLQSSEDLVNLLLDKGADPNGGTRFSPLYMAAINKNYNMLRLLLDRGGDPSRKHFGDLLSSLWATNDEFQIDMLRLLLERGADLAGDKCEALCHAIDGANPESSHSYYVSKKKLKKILNLMLHYGIRLLDNPESDETKLKLGKYCQLLKSILENCESRVKKLLKTNDYSSYAGVLEKDDKRPARLAVIFGRPNLLKIFIAAGADLEDIFFEAVSRSDLETVKLCIPIIFPNEPELLRGISSIFLEANVNNLSPKKSNVSSGKKFSRCELQVILLENGVNPTVREQIHKQHCDKSNLNNRSQCDVQQYLMKLLLIDEYYVKSIINSILPTSCYKNLTILDDPLTDEYGVEFSRMEDIRISQSTSSVPAKYLFELIFLEPNEAARYSTNENILKIYAESEHDFRKLFPHYGSILNYQLRRGTARRKRLESAHEWLCSALGKGMPEALTESVFSHFSNKALERFALKPISG